MSQYESCMILCKLQLVRRTRVPNTCANFLVEPVTIKTYISFCHYTHYTALSCVLWPECLCGKTRQCLVGPRLLRLLTHP